MSHASSILIRADATPAIGTGHVMRCLALAQAAQDAGMRVCIVGRIAVPWVRERLQRENIPLVTIDSALPAREKPEQLLRQLALAQRHGTAPLAWVVLDGYHFGPDWHKAVMSAGYKLLIIDDYCHLPEYHCHILLNQNLGAETFDYAGEIGHKCLGLEYVLLRREFIAARPKALARQRPDVPQNILLTLGGGDFSAHLPYIASCLSIEAMRGKRLRIIAGAMPCRAVAAAFASCPADVEILGRVEDMPALMVDTDLCITAGGSTCWELMCLGVPFLVYEIAENQKLMLVNLHNIYKIDYFSDKSLKKHLVQIQYLEKSSFSMGSIVGLFKGDCQ